MVARVLVAQFPEQGRLAVIDGGMGPGRDERDRGRYAIDGQTPGIVRALARLGISADEVTDAVITHLHFDHIGGFVVPGSSGEGVPTFPRARYHVQREQWEWANDPSIRDRGSFREEQIRPLRTSGQLNFIDGDHTLFPGFQVLNVGGHTPGLQVPLISGKTGTVAYPTDLIPTSAHVRRSWIMAYDLFPLDSLEAKVRLLSRAVDEGWMLLLEHDPQVASITVSTDGEEFTAHPCVCPAVL